MCDCVFCGHAGCSGRGGWIRVVRLRNDIVRLSRPVRWSALLRRDVFFMLFGFVHKAPFRFCSGDEIHVAMRENGWPVVGQDVLGVHACGRAFAR